MDKPELKAEEGLNSVVYDALADLADERGQLISQLENRVEELEASLLKETEQAKTFFDRMNQLEAELLDLKRAERDKAVTELFADLNREVTPEAMLPYLTMSDGLFAVVAEDMRSLKPKSFSESLFREVATGGMKESATEASLAAQLYNQVAGIK